MPALLGISAREAKYIFWGRQQEALFSVKIMRQTMCVSIYALYLKAIMTPSGFTTKYRARVWPRGGGRAEKTKAALLFINHDTLAKAISKYRNLIKIVYPKAIVEEEKYDML